MFNAVHSTNRRASSPLTQIAVLAISSLWLNSAQAQTGLSSLRSAFDQDAPRRNIDVTEAYLERTVADKNAPQLSAEIPEQPLRSGGPRILVKKFLFDELVEFSDAGITREAVESRAEALRAKYMREPETFTSGYTRGELEELGDYLEQVGAQISPEEITLEDMKQLVEIVRQQSLNRGLGYSDLEQITRELTGYYREQGLFLAKVVMPSQDVENGVVKLSVMEGRLGQISVENNRKYRGDTLSQSLEADIGELVSHQQVEEGIYLLNDLPGLSVAGYFSAGDSVGETRLNLNVREEKSYAVAVRLDNHGSTFTGDQRLYTTVDWFNPVGMGDSLRFAYLKSESPGNSVLNQFAYSLPLFGSRTRVEFSYDLNDFKLTDTDDPENFINRLAIEGENTSYAASVEHKFIRSRGYNISAGVSLVDKKTAVTSIDPTLYGSETHVGSGELNLYIDRLSESIRMLNMGNFTLQYGRHRAPASTAEESDYRGDDLYKFGLDTNSLLFVPLPFTETESRLIVRSHWQYSEQPLPAFEQYSLGGANGVRGFSVRDFSADSAAFVSTEWYPDMPAWPLFSDYRVGDLLQLGMFAETAYGFSNRANRNASTQWAALGAAGIVMKLNWNESFASKMSIASPLFNDSSSGLNIGDDAESFQIFVDLTFFL